MAKRKITLVLTEAQLVKLSRLVGNHTCGSDKHMYPVFEKLCTLLKNHTGEHTCGNPGMQAYCGNEWPVIDLDQEYRA